MTDLSQSEFGRAVRGAPPGELDVEYFILGMGSSARAAIRRIHAESPGAARAYLAAKLSDKLLQGGSVAAIARELQACVEQYIAWDGTAAAPLAMPTKGTRVTFPPGNVVRARPDVVLPGGAAGHEARILLWDELSLDRDSAEQIALPVVEYVDAEFGSGAAGVVRVWHLKTGQQETVNPDDARSRQADVEALLSSL